MLYYGENMEKIISKREYRLYGFETEGCHIIPSHLQPKKFCGDGIIWLLPYERAKKSVRISCGKYTVLSKSEEIRISFDGEIAEEEYPFLPVCDFFGNPFVFDIPGKEELEETFAAFYWYNQLCEIAERTLMRKKKKIREGYVLSTLDTKAYAGTYPAVDHEFHMKGRLAVAGKAEEQLIRRMLLLQIKIMREDKKGLNRNVCSVQPSGKREYNVWRRSMDKKTKAQMFRITANVEFTEGVYNYYALTKDMDFLREYIKDIENNCEYIESFISDDGILDSNVYFEDQVIKDYTVLQAQMFTANSFRLMAELEEILGRTGKSAYYRNAAEKLGYAAMRPFPEGFWDSDACRFIDWIDKEGRKHDRIHLLSNRLPSLFGFASPEQALSAAKATEENKSVFDLFPSFVAARVEDYTSDEIGSGGPYDLCAAGRYWCWEAEYLAKEKDGESLFRQIMQVSRQAKDEGYMMGERYDMNHIYYNTGSDKLKPWHGASAYYEYPNVWIYVLICKYLGIWRGTKADVCLAPLFENGSVTAGTYGISFTVKDKKITEISNSSNKSVTVDVTGQNAFTEIPPGSTVSLN